MGVNNEQVKAPNSLESQEIGEELQKSDTTPTVVLKNAKGFLSAERKDSQGTRELSLLMNTHKSSDQREPIAGYLAMGYTL